MTDRSPKHIAIIMDGNGRWAVNQQGSRTEGHKAGAVVAKKIVTNCLESNIPHLTLFAFSTENWLRPVTEVNFLMTLFYNMLSKELEALHQQNISIRFIGDRSKLSKKIIQLMENAETLTIKNSRLILNIAFNYSGRWDITQAFNRLLSDNDDSKLSEQDVTTEALRPYLALDTQPYPDLLIRTSGECRISNFYLWQLTNTPLYFTETLWPDFNSNELKQAINWWRQQA